MLVSDCRVSAACSALGDAFFAVAWTSFAGVLPLRRFLDLEGELERSLW